MNINHLLTLVRGLVGMTQKITVTLYYTCMKKKQYEPLGVLMDP